MPTMSPQQVKETEESIASLNAFVDARNENSAQEQQRRANMQYLREKRGTHRDYYDKLMAIEKKTREEADEAEAVKREDMELRMKIEDGQERLFTARFRKYMAMEGGLDRLREMSQAFKDELLNKEKEMVERELNLKYANLEKNNTELQKKCAKLEEAIKEKNSEIEKFRAQLRASSEV